VITAATLAQRARRKLEVLVRQVAGDPTLKDCRTPRCTACSDCRELSPLTGLPWAVLHARARGRPARYEDDDGRLVRDPHVELLECETNEVRDRAYVKERVRQLAMLEADAARCAREEREWADRELVAAVAARRAKASEKRQLAAERRKERKIAA
jgi:hypothetical protein